MGVKRKFAGSLRGQLLPFQLIDATAQAARKLGYERYELSWVLEDNLPMRRICDAGGAKVYKTYRLYEKALLERLRRPGAGGLGPGAAEPVAAYAGVTHKAADPAPGPHPARPRRLRATRRGRRPHRRRLQPSGRPRRGAPPGRRDPRRGGRPSLSVQPPSNPLGTPLLVTTADHALLEAAWVERFLADVPADADVAALVAARAVVEAAAPTTQRTWLKLADGHWSGCNLFYLANARAIAVVDLWRRVEAERKRPWRQAWILGPGMLLRLLMGRLSLTDAAARLGELAGVRAAIVQTPYGLASVDVDKARGPGPGAPDRQGLAARGPRARHAGPRRRHDLPSRLGEPHPA
jgi:hypothetical protein